MYFKTQGIILAQKNLGEADKILTIYTKDYGKITCVAKGVRRPLSKKSGHVELGNLCKCFIARGKNLDLLTEVELKKSFAVDNFSFEKANKIYHLLEIVDSLTPSGQINQNVFVLLLKFLKETENLENFHLVSSVFKIKLLSTLGFFATDNLNKSKLKLVLENIEQEDFEKLKRTTNFDEKNYLKLLSFLDSIIENLTERKLKTAKFLYG